MEPISPYNIRLAKPSFDVCLSTGVAERILPFWRDTVGLVPEGVLVIRDGLTQYRHAAAGSIIKINHYARMHGQAAPSGYRELLIAREGLVGANSLTDPEGNRVTLLSPQLHGVRQIALRLSVRDLTASIDFYGRALGLPASADGKEGRVAVGESLLLLSEDRAAVLDPPLIGAGFRFLTLQIFDVNAVYRDVIERGGAAGHPPKAVGDIAKYALVRDPDGNWVELSQRASLTGSLEPS
jgi:lactoylglutathione lyase